MEYSEENLKNTSTADLKAMYDMVAIEATEAEFMYERSEKAVEKLVSMKRILKGELNKRLHNIFPL